MKTKKVKEPKVSIILVTYNAENFIRKTIDSCLKQDYPNKEILVLDNNSQDSTKRILKQYTKQNPNIKVFSSKENIGAYPGFNYLINRSSGEFIAIQDHDDLWLPAKIKLQIRFLLKNKDYIGVGTNTYYYFEKEGLIYSKNRSGDTNIVDHTSLVFRKSNMLTYKTDEVLTDEYFQKKTLSKFGKIYCLPEFLTIHRIRGDNKNLSSYRFNFSLKNIKSFYKTNGITLASIIYLLHILFSRYLPYSILWFIRKNIIMKAGKWESIENFKNNVKVFM